MKNIITLCCIAAVALLLPQTTSAQKRVEVKGSVNSFLVSDKGFWGLETDRMYVLPLVYKSISPVGGKYFIVENKSSRMGICNVKGKFIFPCQYAKISLEAGQVELFEEIGEDPKYFHISDPYTELDPPAKQVTQTQSIPVVTAHELGKEADKSALRGTYFDATDINQKEAVELAQKASAAAPAGAFELLTNRNGHQVLMVDNQEVFVSSETCRLITDAEHFNRTKTWVFIVSQNPTGMRVKHGVLTVKIDRVDGKREVSKKMTIPMEHSFISFQKGNHYWAFPIITQDEPQQTWLKCSVWGGGVDMRNIYGKTPSEVRAEGGSKSIVNNICRSDNRLVIKEVIVGTGFTEVIIEYTHAGDMDMFKIDIPPASWLSNLYFIATHDKHLPLRATERFWKDFMYAGSKMTFSLLFGGLPSGCTHFNLLEGEKGTRHFYDIKLNQQ